METPFTYGSVCSGIEAATVAWAPLGWRAAWLAEIDAFPSAVLAHHYPGTPNLGDFTQIQAPEGSIDLLVGGTPCQPFSVAGLRGGLADDRGNLALEYLRLAGRLRPRWIVWENVPGVLSSNGGRDFGAFLGALEELGYGWAYRVLDAQHFGVPQRRRRVFVVGHLGDWRRPAAVLFEPDCLRGNPPKGGKAGKDVASSLTGSLGRRNGQPDGGGHNNHLIAATLNSGGNDGGFRTEPGEHLVPEAFSCHEHGGFREGLGMLTARQDKDGYLAGLITQPGQVAHTLRGDGFDASEDGTGRGTPLVAVDLQNTRIGGDVSGTLDTSTPSKGGGLAVLQPIPFDTTQITSGENRCRPEAGDPNHPLAAKGHAPAIAFQERGREGGRNLEWQEEQSYALRSINGGGCGDWFRVAQRSAVRRLTPRECERLQGFPDDYTLVAYRGKPAADGPRYKALGNSMAVPVMAWIGRRIEVVRRIAAD